MIKEKLISVIVPIYNVERFIDKCLDSLVNQTSKNFTAILVNDGSKDKSGEIAKQYSMRYPDLFVYCAQENKGLGAARNTGIRNASTEYIMFLDSDDWLFPRTIEKIYRALEKEQERPDAIFMNPIVYNMANNAFEEWADVKLLNSIFERVSVTCPHEKYKMYELEASVCRTVWKKSYFIEGKTFFPEGVKWEDVPVHFKVFHELRRCIKIDGAGFFYRINSGKQITASTGNDRLDIIKVYADTLIYAIQNNWSNDEAAYIVSMLQSFAEWSLSVARPEVRKKLAYLLHMLYKSIPKDYLDAYKRIFNSKKNVLFVNMLKWPMTYKILGNHFKTRKYKRLLSKVKRS